MQLFGRAGMDSLDFINTYVTEGARIEEISKKFGIPQEQLESAANLKATMGELQFVFENIAVKIGSELMPAFIKLEPLILKIADQFTAWLGDETNVQTLQGIVNGVGELVNNLIQFMNIMNNIKSGLSSVQSGPRLPGLGELFGNIGGFASGGIVSQPQLAMVGEAGPEAIIPLSQMGGMGGSVSLNIYGYYGDDMSRRALMRDLEKLRNEETRRSFTPSVKTDYYSPGGHL
jgi:hypothetical protein